MNNRYSTDFKHIIKVYITKEAFGNKSIWAILKAQKIKDYNIKAKTKINVPNFAHIPGHTYELGHYIKVNNWFYNQLVFVNEQLKNI